MKGVLCGVVLKLYTKCPGKVHGHNMGGERGERQQDWGCGVSGVMRGMGVSAANGLGSYSLSKL